MSKISKKNLLVMTGISVVLLSLPLAVFLVQQRQIIEKQAAGNTYYVAINGSNSNPGTLDQPWQTIEFGISQLTAGETLIIRGGEYTGEQITISEGRSGTESQPITVKNYPGETVVLKGNSSTSVLRLNGADYWIFDGLEIRDQQTGGTPAVSLNNASDHNIFRNFTIRDSTSYGLIQESGSYNLYENSIFENIRNFSGSGDRHGLELVNGDNNIIRNNFFKNISADGIQLAWTCSASLNNTLIEGNEFLSENASDFPVPGCGENGIDIKCARGGTIIRGNIIHGFRPTAGMGCASGSPGEGIVVHQGAENVTIEGNIIYDNVYGIVVSGGAENVVIRNNIFRDHVFDDSDNDTWCNKSAITFGGAANISVYHNTIINDDWYLCGFGASGLTFKNNLIYNSDSDGGACGDCEADYNGWFQVQNPLSGANDTVGQDPGFVDLTNKDFHLLSNSPVIDQGTNVGVNQDLDGTPRPQGEGFDIGAYEYTSGVVPTVPSSPSPTSVPGVLPPPGNVYIETNCPYCELTPPE